MRRTPRPRLVGIVALPVAVLLAVGLGSAAAGAADGSNRITVEGVVEDRPVDGADSNDPVLLHPDRRTIVELTVTNDTNRDVVVSRARLFGRAFGITFVAYDALVDAPVGAGESTVIRVPVEFIDLERQATGLLPGGFAVYDADRELLAEQEFVIDVRGSVTSALGLLGFFVLVTTALGLFGTVLAVQRGTLGANRVRRAVRFGAVGLGVGIAGVLALAVFRVLAPTDAVWLPVTVVPAVIGAVLGYLSPGPLRPDDEPFDDELGVDSYDLDTVAGRGEEDGVGTVPAGFDGQPAGVDSIAGSSGGVAGA